MVMEGDQAQGDEYTIEYQMLHYEVVYLKFIECYEPMLTDLIRNRRRKNGD